MQAQIDPSPRMSDTVRGHAAIKDPGVLPRRTRATEPPPPPVPPKRTISQPPATPPPAAPPAGPPQAAVSGEISSNKRAELKLEQLLTSRGSAPATTVPSMVAPMPPQARSPITLPPPLPKVPMPVPTAAEIILAAPQATTLKDPVKAVVPRHVPVPVPTIDEDATTPGIDPMRTPIPGSVPPLKSRAAKTAEPAATESRGQIMGIGMSAIAAGSVAGEIPTKVPPGGRVLVPGPNGLMQSATVRQLLSGYYELEVGSSGETIWVPLGGVVPE
jgi:hypothetical protein